jgi:hypothetical protein
MDLTRDGERLVEECQLHILRAMWLLPDCQPGGKGAGSYEIERATGFGLALRRQDNWFTWSLLQRMARDNTIEAIRKGRTKYRLVE